MLRDADATLYHAKRRGKSRAEHFDAELRIDVLERLAVPQELRTAFTAGGDEVFCLHQSEIDLSTGELFAFESLVRWQHPERGLRTPDRFVPLAETAGLTGQLFSHVLERTLLAQHWAMLLGSRPAISVNLSARDLDDDELPGRVAMALARTETPTESLWLEVTETAIANAGSFHTLQALHDLGVHQAIDDFGTGWSPRDVHRQVATRRRHRVTVEPHPGLDHTPTGDGTVTHSPGRRGAPRVHAPGIRSGGRCCRARRGGDAPPVTTRTSASACAPA